MDEIDFRTWASASSGGSAATSGIVFQAQVFAWWSTCAVMEIPFQRDYRDGAVIEAVGSETGFPVDDVGVALRGGGFVLIQAKAGMRQISTKSKDLRDAVRQVVSAAEFGIPTFDGSRQLNPELDRLVIVTNEDGAATFMLAEMFARLRGLPDHAPLASTTTTDPERHALRVLRELITQEWRDLKGVEPSLARIHALLRCMEITRLDFKEPLGADLGRCLVRLADPRTDRTGMKAFRTLFDFGVRAALERRWFKRQHMQRATGRQTGQPGDAPNHLAPLPYPYIPRDAPPVQQRLRLLVTGAPGIGKTAYAVSAAHDHADDHPDGQLMIDLRGFGPGGPMTSDEAIDELLRQMRVPEDEIPSHPSARRLRYLEILENGRLLVVLDNVSDSEIVLPLLPRRGSSGFIITSRSRLGRLISVADVETIDLGPLPPSASRDLLIAMSGPSRELSPSDVDSLLKICGGIPLVLRLIGARLKESPRRPVSHFTAGSDTPAGRLDLLDLGETGASVRQLYAWSITDLSPPVRRAFTLLGAAPAPHLDDAAISALLQENSQGSVLSLYRLNLVEELADGYMMHDLLRDYALWQLQDDPLLAAEHVAANQRLLRHYRDIAEAQARPHWSSEELVRLLSVVRWGMGHGSWPDAFAIVDAMIEPLWRAGRFLSCVDMLRSTLHEGEHRLPSSTHSYVRRQLAITLRRAGRPDESAKEAELALSVLDGEQASVRADAHYVLAVAHTHLGDHSRAAVKYRAALHGFEAAKDHSGMADALNGLGWSNAELGLFDEALVQCERAAVIHRALNKQNEHAADLDSIACIHQMCGNPVSALPIFRECLDIYREIGHLPNEVRTLESLAECHEEVGDRAAALECWNLALALHHRIEPVDENAVQRLTEIIRSANRPLRSVSPT
ncbi:ATP-binding protein [Streptosporangium saharense]|uniref:ATP-binding protein n=1 Tax=Streptosporangium saharense TaxID=1706840 RepID=UPI0036C42386